MARKHTSLFGVAAFLFAATLTIPLQAEDAKSDAGAQWRISQPLTQYSQYTGFALGLDGRVWVADETDREFLVFSNFQKFTTLSAGGFVPQRMTRGSDGNLYANEGDTSILKLTPTGTMTTLSVGQSAGYGIMGGPDGSVWVAEDSEVGRIYPNGRVREYPVEPGDMLSGGTAIAQAPGGDVWFDAGTPGYSYYLASLDPETGKIAKHFTDSCGYNEIWPIVAGADGRVSNSCGSIVPPTFRF